MISKKEALEAKTTKPKVDKETGLSFSTLTINKEKYKLYHSLSNGRLDEESFEEYQIRKYHIKKFKKDAKKGNVIWYAKNTQAVNDYKLANYLVGLKASSEKVDEESLKESMQYLKMTEDIAKKTNLGTYDKKKIKTFMEKIQAEKAQKETKKTNTSEE